MKFIFPSVIISLNVAAGIVYLCQGDWKHAIYWTSAAVLTATVTF